MISYICGELIGVENEKIIVNVQGVGFAIFLPQKGLGQLPAIGQEVRLYTHLHVREDAMQLFGFLSREELELFRMLLGVSGLGPKGGLNVLSSLTAAELTMAILSGDAKAIAAAKGIGKKLAEKLILELKDKIDPTAFTGGSVSEVRERGATRGGVLSGAQEEAVQALIALGYGSSESWRAVTQVETSYDKAEEILKEALRYLL